MDAAITMAHPGAGTMTADLTVAEVFRDHGARVLRFLRYLGVREAQLHDAAQEVFVVVHRRLPEFRGEARLETWLYEICLRVAHASRRAERKHASLAEDAVAADEPATVPAERHAARELLLRALATLDPAQAEVFVLSEVEELPMREVARLAGCPLFTAYSRRRLARVALRRALARLEEEGT